MAKINILIIIFIFSISSYSFSQDRYAIHYKYKPSAIYHLEAPELLLTPKALGRRLKEKIAVDSTDLPVAEQYIASLENKVDQMLYHSKWLNASVVIAGEEAIREIEGLDFVDKVVLVARGGRSEMQNSTKEVKLKTAKNSRRPNKKDLSFEFQNNILGIPQMHEDGFNGEGISIAVFDAGFLNVDEISGMKHLFDNEQIIATRDFVHPGDEHVYRTDTHGTGSLSLLAAYDPQLLVSGAYGSEYILCITEDVGSEYRVEEYNWVRAAEFSDSLGVDIINSSLGYNLFDDPEMNYTREDLDGVTAVISLGAAMAAQKGILVVTSTGNEGNISWKTITFPADAKGILSVGAITNNFEKAGFSSIGPSSDGRIKPELVAYGSGVTIWKYGDGVSSSSGTSFSAPQIAALAAGLWQANPDWTRAKLKERLLVSGSQFTDPDFELGYGVPNYMRAMYGIINGTKRQIAGQDPKVYPNPLDNQELFIEFGSAASCNFKLYNTSGKLVSYQPLARNQIEQPYLVNLQLVQPGIYVVELEDDSGAAKIKLFKK